MGIANGNSGRSSRKHLGSRHSMRKTGELEKFHIGCHTENEDTYL